MHVRSLLVVGSLAVVCACSTWAEHAATPTPQRPTVSSSTSTTAPGTFELEAGGAIDVDEFYDTPLTLKWGADEGAELFAGWSPIVFQERPGPNEVGVGDLSLGVRARFLDETDGGPAAALRLEAKLPTASESKGIGTGEFDFFGALSVGKTLGDFQTIGFYRLGVLGEPTGGQEAEHTLALLGAYSLSDEWSVLAELSGVYRPEGGSEPAQLIVSFGHAATAHGYLDVGLSLGLNSDANDAVLLIGWTQNFGGPGPRTGE